MLCVVVSIYIHISTIGLLFLGLLANALIQMLLSFHPSSHAQRS